MVLQLPFQILALIHLRNCWVSAPENAALVEHLVSGRLTGAGTQSGLVRKVHVGEACPRVHVIPLWRSDLPEVRWSFPQVP